MKLRFRLGMTSVLMLTLLAWSPGLTALAAPHNQFPEVIDLPAGFQPEGVAMGRGTTIYAGSTTTGAIYTADIRTGDGQLLVPAQSGRAALGLEFDPRTGYLFVAGGPTGQGYIYDSTGANVAAFTLTTATPTFVNDVAVTQEAAYFTDSSRPVLYRVPLLPNGRVPAGATVTEILLGGDFVFVPGQFNANGIEALPGGHSLIIDNTFTGNLYQVDPQTGNASLIALQGGTAASGDGLLLVGHTLYVSQNFLNQISEIQLAPDFSTGTVTDVLTDPDLDIPSTVTSFGSSLYAVNARFTTPPAPTTSYWIAQLPR